MRGSMKKQILLLLPLLVLAASGVHAGQVVSQTARAVPAVAHAGGFGLTPVGTQPAQAGDLAPVQLFEITKPAGQSVTIARMFTSCTCVRLEADKRTYGPGERAILRLRNVLATPPGGQSYALYVQLAGNTALTLRYDTFVQSSQFVPAPVGAPPTRGNIVADGVLTADAGPADGEVDIIVPKAENYLPDTSEYAIKKKTEAGKEVITVGLAKKDTASGGVQPATETAKAQEAPRANPQLHSAIDAAIAQAERDLARSTRVSSEPPTVSGLNEKARAEAAVAAGLSTNQSKTYQSEAQLIARDVLRGGSRQPVGEKEDDPLWRTPKPRGETRTVLSRTPATQPAPRSASSSLSSTPRVSTPRTTLMPTPAPQSAPVVSQPSTPAEPPAQVVDVIETLRTPEAIQAAESSIADRAREAARKAGKTATDSLRSAGNTVTGQAQKVQSAVTESIRGTTRSAQTSTATPRISTPPQLPQLRETTENFLQGAQ